MRLDFDDGRTSQKHQQIHKMAYLYQNPPAALLGIVDPMIGRKKSGINAIVQCQRLGDRCQKRFHPRAHRRKPAIETNHQLRPMRGGNAEVSANYETTFLLRQAEWLLAKHVL